MSEMKVMGVLGRAPAEMPPIFTNEWVEINGLQVSMDSWESEAERRHYREKAELFLNFYRNDVMELDEAEGALRQWQELTWKDVFDASSVLRGMDYAKDRVQSSNISDEPYQVYVAAESKLERNKRERDYLEREVETWRKRVEHGKAYLNLLRGQTRTVAELLWFSERKLTWDEIANKLGISRPTVQRERDRTIEAVAWYLKRTEYRRVRLWFL